MPKTPVTAAVRLIVLLALALATADVSAGQSARPLRPFPALFGPTELDLKRPARLDVNWSFYEAMDDNSFLSNDADILDPALQSDRAYTGMAISLAHVRRLRRSVLNVNLASAGRYYEDLHQVVTTRHGGMVSFDTYPTKDWRLQLSNAASFSPYYQVVLGPSGAALWGDAPAPADDYSVSKQRAMQYSSAWGVTRTFGPQTTLVMNYGGRYTDVFGGRDSSSQRAGFQFTQGLSKDIGLKIGYAYGVTTTPANVSIRNNDLDLGVNYGRTFSPSVRTSFGFSTGSTIVSADDGQHFHLTGAAHLGRRLSPQWSAQISYDRGLQVPDGATQPFFSDTVGASLSGYFSRRISLRVQPSYSHGFVGQGGTTNPYHSYSSTTRFELALHHRVALYAEHFYYRYEFASAAGLPGLLSTGMNRQGARIGLTLWTPLAR